MVPHNPLLKLALLLLYGISGPVAAASLCDAAEQVLFDCAIRGSTKRVSLCGSQPLSRDAGYLQYRFGRPGRVELAFPQVRSGSLQQFRWAHYLRPRVDRTEIGFENGGYRYSLYDDYQGDVKPIRRERGIAVTGPGEPSTSTDLVCVGPVTSKLGSLASVVPCDADSALNLGSCP
jgi:hypothetical protein